MFSVWKLILILVCLGSDRGRADIIKTRPQVEAHVGDTVMLECVFQSTGKKHLSKVDWNFIPTDSEQEEVILYYYNNLSVPVGRFQNRTHLTGSIAECNASIVLRDIGKADHGTYTCELHLINDSRVFKNRTLLRVIPAESRRAVFPLGHTSTVASQTPVTSQALSSKTLISYQLVIIVGIVCVTVVLLALLWVGTRGTQRCGSSAKRATPMKNLENTSKENLEKNIYSLVPTLEVPVEEVELKTMTEAAYMTMEEEEEDVTWMLTVEGSSLPSSPFFHPSIPTSPGTAPVMSKPLQLPLLLPSANSPVKGGLLVGDLEKPAVWGSSLSLPGIMGRIEARLRKEAEVPKMEGLQDFLVPYHLIC
ncbi:junctional adhesion molecule-like [Tachyglossus aculeatus]|uniref:junctional adhesion molecule-like n=1 Tax=Tachyglossus aculeatus TaxID=9261 RepID=UPI0018F5B427|nr:junctional adhesion molecule-like [Tachyglossus aculeatus]